MISLVHTEMFLALRLYQIIYVARNPKDVVVSFYHFDKMNQLHPEPGPWEGYVGKFIQGNSETIAEEYSVIVRFLILQIGHWHVLFVLVAFGSWGSHVREFWALKQEKNILYLFYEDMLEVSILHLVLLPQQDDKG